MRLPAPPPLKIKALGYSIIALNVISFFAGIFAAKLGANGATINFEFLIGALLGFGLLKRNSLSHKLIDALCIICLILLPIMSVLSLAFPNLGIQVNYPYFGIHESSKTNPVFVSIFCALSTIPFGVVTYITRSRDVITWFAGAAPHN